MSNSNLNAYERMRRPNVLLLRAPNEDAQADPYEEQLRTSGFNPHSLPVLEIGYVNSGELQQIMSNDPAEQKISGVIITSGRAVDAWKNAVQGLTDTNLSIQGHDWREVPFYVVGPSTAKSLHDIESSYPASPYTPTVIQGGTETGTSERLAHYIVSHLSSKKGPKTLLYLTGDKNRDTLPGILVQAGIDLLSLQVYETHGSTSFEASLEKLLNFRTDDDKGTAWWTVFFAPSSSDFALPILRNHFYFSGIKRGPLPATKLLQARVAAIGPTTAKHLHENLFLHVDVTSSKPRPEDLAEALSSCGTYGVD